MGKCGALLGALGLALLLVCPLALVWAKKDAKQDARIELIRGLAQEVGVSKVALPRGKKGIVLDALGQLDKEKSDAELRANGMAIRPGMPIQITKIVFKSDRMTLEINGGGKKGKKWYQRIEVGAGGRTRPISPEAPVLAYGSFITLTYPEKNELPTVAQAKQLLGSVVDLERRSPTTLLAASSPENQGSDQEAPGPCGNGPRLGAFRQRPPRSPNPRGPRRRRARRLDLRTTSSRPFCHLRR